MHELSMLPSSTADISVCLALLFHIMRIYLDVSVESVLNREKFIQEWWNQDWRCQELRNRDWRNQESRNLVWPDQESRNPEKYFHGMGWRKKDVFTSPRNGGVIFTLQFVSLCVCVCMWVNECQWTKFQPNGGSDLDAVFAKWLHTALARTLLKLVSMG